jgi:hypothetical protein
MIRALILATGLLLAACSVFLPEESAFLQSGKDRASRGQVEEQWGKPQAVARLDNGEQIWVYDQYTLEPGGQSTWTAGGSRCDRYTLRFDDAGILRQWWHESYRHGGETMPQICLNPAERGEPQSARQ